MKKTIFLLLIFILLIPSFCFAIEYNINIDCPNVYLVDDLTGRVLYNRNSFEHVPPASTTKIMTAILVLEKGKITDRVTASYDAIMSVPSGASNTAIQVGEVVSVENLLECMLVVSGNEAANVLAEYIGGSMSNFAKLMNEKAKEIGCNDTNFVNPNGLHDDNHYSCAHDITIMYKYAYDNFEDFRRIIGLKNITVPTSDKYEKDDRKFSATTKLLKESSKYYYDKCNGGKTGYTKEAKNCLVASAKSGDTVLICCVLGGSQDESNDSQRYNDTILLFDKGFESIVNTTFLNKGTIIKKIKVLNAKESNAEISAIASEDLNIAIDKDASISDFATATTLEERLVAPISSGDKVGEITYNVYGITYTVDLVADKDIAEVPPTSFWDVLKIIIGVIITTSIMIVIIRIYNISKHKKSRSRHILSVKRYNSRFHK